VPALPTAAADLGVSGGTIQLTLTLYLVGLASGQLLYGPLSDAVGRRPALLGGLLLYAAGSLACAVAPEASSLIAARVVQALGGCSGLVLGRAILRDVSAPREAAAKLALLNLFQSIAPASAPMVGGLLATFLGWRAIFLLLAAIGVVTLAATLRTLPETNPGHGGGGFGAMLRSYARLLALPEYRALAIGGACSTTSFFAFLSAAPFIFTGLLHRPESEIGFYFVVPILGFSIGSFIANRLARRVDPLLLMLATSAIATIGATLFMALEIGGHLSVVTVLATILVFTIGSGTVSPMALSTAIGVQPGMIGAAAGLYGFCQMGYGAICTLLVSQWHANPAEGAAVVLLGSTAAGFVALVLGVRALRSGR
jgi:DHA1 family bicyclomycin/chloramphenicol resistance-like MFS transporter